MKTIIAQDKEHLIKLIEQEMKLNGNNCDLNHINISKITNMHTLFSVKPLEKFNGNISRWDVSHVTMMPGMFAHSNFNGDISQWNTSNVENMWGMFTDSAFDGDLSKWNVSNVENMKGMFHQSDFTGDISKWDTSNVEDMRIMFKKSHFNGDISNWNTSNVENMSAMFMSSHFDSDISQWDVRKVTAMHEMFKFSAFNQNLDSWQPLLANIEDIFETAVLLEYKPYWSKYEEPYERRKAIELYCLAKNLDNSLNDKNNQTHKQKL
jgi:surface protein